MQLAAGFCPARRVNSYILYSVRVNMPRPSAGNSGMSSKVDASGSSSMTDVFMWFRPGATVDKRQQGTGILRVLGLGKETSEEDIRGLLGRYYSTVRSIKMVSSTALVTFGMEGERDRAIAELQGTIPVKRFCGPEEVAHAVAFLASPLAGFITGEVIDMNGGFQMD